MTARRALPRGGASVPYEVSCVPDNQSINMFVVLEGNWDPTDNRQQTATCLLEFISFLVSLEPSAEHAGAFSVAQTPFGSMQHSYKKEDTSLPGQGHCCYRYGVGGVAAQPDQYSTRAGTRHHSFSQQYMQDLIGNCDNKACSCRCEQSHASCAHQLHESRRGVQEGSQACRVLADALKSVCFQLAVQLCRGCCAAFHGLPYGICPSPSLRRLPPLQQCNADMQCLT